MVLLEQLVKGDERVCLSLEKSVDASFRFEGDSQFDERFKRNFAGPFEQPQYRQANTRPSR
jgi:hypothetical protein